MIFLPVGSVFNSFSQRPVPLTEVKVSPPKFDLAATNFPPLPGCVVSTQGEPVLENRMSDVVRGLYRDKVRKWVCKSLEQWCIESIVEMRTAQV